MAPAEQHTLKDTFQGLLGLGLILGALYFMGIVDLPLGNETAPTESPPSASPRVQQPPSTIKASIQDFKEGVPMFEMEGLSRQQEPGGIEYSWDSKDDESWIKFYDYGSDGRLDRISALFEVPANDNAATIKAIGFSYRLIEIASGVKPDAETFTAWLGESAEYSAEHGRPAVKLFGQTPVRVQAMLVGQSPGMRLVIGAE